MKSVLDSLEKSAAALDGRTGTGDELRRVPVDAITPDPDQPRSTLQESPEEHAAGLASLAQSIKEMGILTPPLVSYSPVSKSYTLIAGERRWRAAQLAGRTEIPVLVRGASRPTDETTRRLEALTENLQREDLTLWETAGALKDLLALQDGAVAVNQDMLAARLGKSKAWVSAHVAVAKAEGPAADAVRENLLRTADSFRIFRSLPAAERDRLLARARRTGEPLVRSELEKIAKRVQGSAPQDVASGGEGSYVLRLDRSKAARLFELLGLELPDSPVEASRMVEARLSNTE